MAIEDFGARSVQRPVDIQAGPPDLQAGVPGWGRGAAGPTGGGTPVTARAAASRGRRETAEPAAGLTSAPRLLRLPLRTRRQSRSAPRCSARAPALRAPAAAPPPPTRGPGAVGGAPAMARAQALVLVLTFQLCAPETETPAGKRAAVGPGLPREPPGPVA